MTAKRLTLPCKLSSPPPSPTHLTQRASHPQHRKFCISIAGFLPPPPWSPLFSPPYTTPTLHVLGTNDVIVTPERGRTLVAASAGARVAMHDGGHFVPTKQTWRHFLRDYMRDPFGDVPNPPGPGEGGRGGGGGEESAPASAAETPVASVPASGRATPSVGADADADAKPETQSTSVIENSTAISEDKIPATSNL